MMPCWPHGRPATARNAQVRRLPAGLVAQPCGRSEAAWRDATLTEHESAKETNVSDAPVRSTIYLDPALHPALRMKAAVQHRSMSDIVNEAVRSALREDQEDLAAFEERAAEQPISYEALLARLKANGTL